MNGECIYNADLLGGGGIIETYTRTQKLTNLTRFEKIIHNLSKRHLHAIPITSSDLSEKTQQIVYAPQDPTQGISALYPDPALLGFGPPPRLNFLVSPPRQI